MKKMFRKGAFWSLCGCVILLSACHRYETVVTRETSEEGSTSVKNIMTKERVGRCGKRLVERQIVNEKIQCIGRNGKPIAADTVEECISKKGRVVEEIVTETKK